MDRGFRTLFEQVAKYNIDDVPNQKTKLLGSTVFDLRTILKIGTKNEYLVMLLPSAKNSANVTTFWSVNEKICAISGKR